MSSLRANPTVALRPVTDDDWPFLESVYASTRQEELAQVPWSDAQKAAFLSMQFNAQKSHYEVHFPDASYDVIEVDGAPAGRLYVDEREDELRIVDIALLPQHRGAGIGAKLLNGVMDRARESEREVRIHVEHNNPALSLYERLGFEKREEHGVYWLMAWRPSIEEAATC